MKIAAAQTIPYDGNVDANIEAHLRLATQAALQGVSVIVFPEMSLTGYVMETARNLAFTEDDSRLAPLQQLSAEKGITIIAGAPVAINDKLHIGALIVQPGSTSVYTKQFLHTGEEFFFEPGFIHNPLIELNAQRISVAVCADINNPLHPQNAHKQNTTLYIAGIFFTPDGIEHAHKQLSGYATAYHMYVLMANYGGPSYALDAAGRSACWNKKGELIAQLSDEGEGLLVIDYVN